MSSDSKHELIALTGFMGSGKSSVGYALALLLGWRFCDLDREIERAQGRNIREIFSTEGEARFREIETECLRSMLATVIRPFVLATGGGTYVRVQNAELLRSAGATVVLLEAALETLMNRCSPEGKAGETRPLAQDRDAFLKLYEQRLPAYRAAAVTVTSDSESPDTVARKIAQMLGLEAV